MKSLRKYDFLISLALGAYFFYLAGSAAEYRVVYFVAALAYVIIAMRGYFREIA